MLLAIYFLCNGFSFWNQDFLYIKGFFRFRDIIFIVLLVMTLLTIRPQHTHLLNRSLIKYFIAVLVILSLINSLYTFWRWDYTLNELIAVARLYPLYLVFFATILLIRNEVQLKEVIIIAQYFIIIFSILFITQSLVGNKFSLFPYPYRFEAESVLSGVSRLTAFRLRAWGKFVPAYFMPFFFALFISTRHKKHLFFLGVTFLATLLTFDRTIVFAAIVAILLGVFLISSLNTNKSFLDFKSRKILLPITILVFSLYMVNLFSTELYTSILTRFTSIPEYILEKKGTYGDRLGKLEYALTEIVPDNLFMGVGLFHANRTQQFMIERVYPDGHIGIFYILTTTGLFFWLIYMCFILFLLKRYWQRTNQMKIPIYKAVVFMACISILTRVIAWHYMEFADPIGIAVFAFTIGLAELCIYYDQSQKSTIISDESLTYSV